MQGFAFNLRRPLFTDIRVRRAFNYAYDWEESDRQLSTGEYHRDGSFFDGIPELMSSGLPEGQELQILETVRDKVPAEVFTTPYKNPVGGNPEAARNNLREATRLLKDAGFEIRDAKLVDPKGQPVSVEFLCQDPGEERAVLFYKPSLERLGIIVTIRTVDSVQLSKSRPQFRLRHCFFHMGTVTVARQRGARFLWVAIGRQARCAQPPWNQESGGRCLDRTHHLRQGSRRTRSQLQGARSGIALELLSRSTVHLRLSALRAVGSLQPSGPAAQIWHLRISKPVVVGRRESGKDRWTLLKRTFGKSSLSRRNVLGLGAGLLSAAHFRTAAAETGDDVHGISVFGDLKYPADFQHFDYINTAAPKGGLFSLIPSSRAYNQSFLTFNSLNAYILKGEGAQGMDMTFVTLMMRANDEPDAMYGLAAKSVRISPDKLTYSFTMRPEARFHDGSKLTAQDVAFSLTALKEKGHPLIVVQLRDMLKAEASDDTTVVVTFAERRASRCAALCRGPADFFKGLLCDPVIR